jgi:hypothetical protein
VHHHHDERLWNCVTDEMAVAIGKVAGLALNGT